MASVLIDKLTEENIDIIGYPRLVRLNPNIPWKTRGNGAISIQIGKGKGKKTKIGEINGKNLFCYSEKSSKNIKKTHINNIVEATIDKFSNPASSSIFLARFDKYSRSPESSLIPTGSCPFL